jgi:hypothetical protein
MKNEKQLVMIQNNSRRIGTLVASVMCTNHIVDNIISQSLITTGRIHENSLFCENNKLKIKRRAREVLLDHYYLIIPTDSTLHGTTRA